MSNKLRETFYFFLKSYRAKILTFSGQNINVVFDAASPDALTCFKNYENGQYKGNDEIKCRQPRLLKGVIVAKKSWGLHLDMWGDGIGFDQVSTKCEIINEFESKYINIPKKFMVEFDNTIEKYRQKRLSNASKRINEMKLKFGCNLENQTFGF